jgi:EAL domain-containing protein (putative c-di-GMP-specific phosphodiesterase class I)
VRLAVDDTGAGYASLNHVLQVRPDIIKLDRTLIAGLTEDRARRSLVTALVLLGLDIGASLTGEGTETLQQLDALNTLGVEHAQGYALARPTTDRQMWLTGRSEI